MSSQEQWNVSAQDILAVVPTYNEEGYIEACLRSLIGTSDLDIKIVVADGMSTDRTREIVAGLQAEFPNLHFLENPKRLQSAAVNLAAEAMSEPGTKYLVRCDAHSIYPPGFIRSVAQSLQKIGAASVVIPMDAIGEQCFEKANAWVVDTPLGSGGSAHRGGRVSKYIDHGHHAGFDIAWFRKLGGYDESFSHNEDAEYDFRLHDAGGEIYLDADIRIQYVPRGSVAALARQYFNYGKGRARTILKHRLRPKLRQLLPVMALLGCVFGLTLAPFAPILAFIPLIYLVVLAFVSVSVTITKRSFCGLWAGVALGTMHMAWGLGFVRQLWRSGTEAA